MSLSNPSGRNDNETPASPSESPHLDRYSACHEQIWQMVHEGNFQAVLDNFINPVIREFEQQYGSRTERVYCANGPMDTLCCLGLAVKDKVTAIVVSFGYAHAYFLKGFIAVEQRDLNQAIEHMSKAVTLSPMNTDFLCELGYSYQSTRVWDKALECFARALSNTPEDDRNGNIARRRALRGQAFVLVELGKIDDAEHLYKKCLEIDPRDQNALHELQCIAHLRAGGRTGFQMVNIVNKEQQ